MFDLNKILFLDIETVAQYKSLKDAPELLLSLWRQKVKQLQQRDPVRYTDDSEELLYRREAGIYAEFGKIVCISVGFFYEKDGQKFFRTTSFAGDDEKVILGDFIEMLDRYMQQVPDRKICGHNIKEFDIPYICRRILVNGMKLPSCLNIAGKKPWDLSYLVDTMELWRFGDVKNFTSLNLLTTILGIPTPKDDIDGSQVANVYYDDADLIRISTYCQKDVLAVARLLARYEGQPLIEDEFVENV